MNQLHQIKKYFQIRFDNVQKAFSNINRVTLFSDSEKRILKLLCGYWWVRAYCNDHERIFVAHQKRFHTSNDDFRVEPYQVFETTRPHKPKLHKPKLRKPKLRKPKLRKPKLRKPKLRKPKLRKPKLHKHKLRKPKLHKHKPKGLPRLSDSISVACSGSRRVENVLGRGSRSYSSDFGTRSLQESYSTIDVEFSLNCPLVGCSYG